jgi:hypothetical protein
VPMVPITAPATPLAPTLTVLLIALATLASPEMDFHARMLTSVLSAWTIARAVHHASTTTADLAAHVPMVLSLQTTHVTTSTNAK